MAERIGRFTLVASLTLALMVGPFLPGSATGQTAPGRPVGSGLGQPLSDGPIQIEAPDAGTLGGWALNASRPGGPHVVIIPGSGPTDLNGNGPLIATDAYRSLAEGLASAGIASVRIDKRGMFSSASPGINPNAVTVDDYVRDTRAWIGALAGNSRFRCVWLAGHSEGGLVAMATAARNPRGICGLILLAAPGRRVSDVLREQLRRNPANAPVLADGLAVIDRLERGRLVDVTGLHPALQGLFAPQVQPFLISLFRFDATRALRAHQLPVLVIQGGADIQVTAADANTLARARRGIRLLQFPAMSHTLKTVPAPGDAAAQQATYRDPSLPLEPQLVPAVADFILRYSR